jgi:uncharacterized membrane protein
VADRRRVAGVGHTFYGCGDNANKKLLDPATANDLELAEKLLTRWERLHSVRSILSLASLLTFLFLLGERRA